MYVKPESISAFAQHGWDKPVTLARRRHCLKDCRLYVLPCCLGYMVREQILKVTKQRRGRQKKEKKEEIENEKMA